MMNLTDGVILIVLAGLGGGGFYVPLKKIRGWAWESYWLVFSVFSWFITPVFVAFLTVPLLATVLKSAPYGSILTCYGLGVIWGFGSIAFGLTLRYLGISLGNALAMGYCAAFGTLLPPIFSGTFGDFITSFSGMVILGGVIVCLVGIGICGWAGMLKDREISDTGKKDSIRDFDYKKGFWVALFCGVISSCYPLAIEMGKPISQHAIAYGTSSLWSFCPVYIFIHAGGCTTNVLYCLFLNFRNKTITDYVKNSRSLLIINFLLSALAGVLWYAQIMTYGVGYTMMGKYDFSSWTIFLAFGIFFSYVVGIMFHEWKGVSRKTIILVSLGLFVLVLSAVVISVGSYLATL
jgi:L-rhamnose-H+ transport protein